MFFDRLEPGKCYSLRTSWGNELVYVTAVDADCVHAKCLEDGRTAAYRAQTILAYKEAAGLSFLSAQGAPEKAMQPAPVPEKLPEPEKETPKLQAPRLEAAEAEEKQKTEKNEEKPEAEKPQYAPPARPVPQRPSALLKQPMGERLKGRLAVYFASGMANAGNGYIELPLPEDAEPDERPERVFFHARQVYEKQLCAFLNTLPRIPDFTGRARGFQLSNPIEVTFVVADNRAHSKVGRPVAGDIRMTEAGRRALREMLSSEHRFLRSATAFVDAFRFAQGHDLCCSVSVQGEDDRAFSALLYEENIADSRLRRFLMENRPRVPDGVPLKVELFRRMAGGRPVGPILAAHARLAGEETPWTERDEMRWADLFTEQDKEKLALVKEGGFDERTFDFGVKQPQVESEEPEEEGEPEPSACYEELPLWPQGETED